METLNLKTWQRQPAQFVEGASNWSRGSGDAGRPGPAHAHQGASAGVHPPPIVGGSHLGREPPTYQRAVRQDGRMIPKFDVDIRRDYDVETLRTGLSAEDVARGFTDHHQYECPGLPSWEQAAECLTQEATLLKQATRSDAPDGVEAILDELRDADDVGYAELMAYTFHWNDVGVAGLSLALSAARIATFYSCSGGLDERHHAKCPTVGIVPDPERARPFVRLVEKHACGIEQTYGRWYIYGRSVMDMHGLGMAVLAARDAFDILPQPSWTEGLTQLLEEMAEE